MENASTTSTDKARESAAEMAPIPKHVRGLTTKDDDDQSLATKTTATGSTSAPQINTVMKGTCMFLALCNVKDGVPYGPILNTDGMVILIILFFLFCVLMIYSNLITL